MIEIIPTIPAHVEELGDNLRQEDVCEVLKFGVGVRKALWRSYRGAVIKNTILIDGKVAAIYGCGGTVIGRVGRPWLLTSPLVEKYYLQLALLYRREAKKMLKIYPVLENIVDAHYHKAVRLLELAGFKLYGPQPLGPNNSAMFRKFRLEASP